MFGLILAVLLSDAPTPSAILDEYRAADLHAGASAGDRVILALWCEEHGLPAGRREQLEKALAIDPDDRAARGLLGFVRDGDRWVSRDEAGEKLRSDSSLAKALADYNTFRDGARGTVADQWRLALWCEANGLPAEALAHFTVVTRLDPEHAGAWRRLGCRKVRGRWMNEDQIAAEKAEKTTQAAADRRWNPWLVQWDRWLSRGGATKEATRALDPVDDPRAVPSIRRVFGQGASWEQAWAVRLFGHVKAPAASQELAALAVESRSERVRDSALVRLDGRDPREFVGLLINRLRDPIRVQTGPPRGPDGLVSLVIETRTAIVERDYEIPPPLRPMYGAASAGGRLQVDQDALLRQKREDRLAARQKIARDLADLEARNAEIVESNRRVVRVLAQATGRDLGPDRETWARSWSNDLGYSYESPQLQPRPTIVTTVQAVAARPVPMVAMMPPSPIARHRSCFAAGTPVHTRNGARPIEDLKIGDEVLSQNTTTGEVAFRPIVVTFHNPPTSTLRLVLDGESITTTGVHRVWKAGQGWTMARDLKPGDPIRLIDGRGRVADVVPDDVQPVFNLEVAGNSDFFVGKSGVLVHDNTLVAPIARPFDSAASRIGD